MTYGVKQAMDDTKRARTAETLKQPSLHLRLRALHFYPTTTEDMSKALKMTSKSVTGCCCRERSRGRLAFCLGGVRHRGGVSLVEALLRNVGTRNSMLREHSK